MKDQIIKKVKAFLLEEKKVSRAIFSFLLIASFTLVFGPSIYAQFMRQTGDSGWGYGYGYGYGHGYGFDGGTLYGYKTDFTDSAADVYGYGHGYGYRASTSTTTVGSVSYQDVGPSSLASAVPTLFTIAGSPTVATSITSADNINITTTNTNGNIQVLIPSGVQITKSDGTAFDATSLTSSNVASSITASTIASNATVQGAANFGVSGITLYFSQPVTVRIAVDSSLNGQAINIARSSDSGATWSTTGLTTASTDTCASGVGSNPASSATVASGYITIYTCQASYFATYSTSSSGSSGGGGGVTTSTSSISINKGAASATSRSVTLTLSSVNATQMAISNTSDFKNVNWETYAISKAWTLTEGLGTKTVYAKFKTSSGSVSVTISDSIVLKEATFEEPDESSYPDGTLLRGKNGFKVYVINGGMKLWIKSADEFEKGGYKWSDIKIVGDDVVIVIGDYTVLLIRGDQDYKVYVIENGKKRHIVSAEAFNAAGYKWSDIQVVATDVVNGYADESLGSVIVKTAKLRVRSASNTKGKILGYVKNGEIYTILAEDNGWYKVSTEAGIGWISGQYATKK